MGQIKFSAWDLGGKCTPYTSTYAKPYCIIGHELGILLWEKYYVHADAILYVVDASDRKRLAASKAEFDVSAPFHSSHLQMLMYDGCDLYRSCACATQFKACR